MEAIMIKLGYLCANIAGDARYTDYLTVYYDPNSDMVKVMVTSSSPVGGMDGPGGVNAPTAEYQASSGAKPTGKVVIHMLKEAIKMDRFNFKRYGKPTKNFRWSTGEQGLNSTHAQGALDAVKTK